MFLRHSNPKSAFVDFSWNASGTYLITFTPESVCIMPASLELHIPPNCPPAPLSQEAVVGIAVGGTLGGLVLIAIAVFVAVKLLRAWNRNLVRVRQNDLAHSASEYYRFD